MLIDPQGRVWPADADTIRRLFGSNLPRQVVTRFVVRNMGWMSLRCAAGEATIACRQGRLSNAAMAAAAYILADKGITRARIATLRESGVIQGLPRILAALESLQSAPGHEGPSHIHRTVPLTESPFAQVRSELTRSGALSLELDALMHACNRMFAGRFTLATAAGPGHPVRIVGIGSSYTHFSRTFYERAAGLRFEDGPDVAYGAWISKTMADALNTLETSSGEVDAEVRYDNNPLRIRYDRVIVPFANERGERFVLSTSSMRDDIDLRARCGEP